MADTGDTGTEPATCPARVAGSGCWWNESRESGVCGPDGEVGVLVEPEPGEVHGGACSCAATPTPSALAPVLLVLLWRWARVALLLVVALPALAQVNAEHVDLDDGGLFPSLTEADLGPRWSGAVTLSANYARHLVVFEDAGGSGPLLTGVVTRTVAASLNLGGVTRIGFAIPRLNPVDFDGRRHTGVQGDVPIWVAIPLTAAANPVRASWSVRLGLATGPQRFYLGDPGSVQGIVAVQFPAGLLTGLLEVGATFHQRMPLPGAVWGNHWNLGFGLRAEPAGPSWFAWETHAEAPVRPWAGQAVHYPLQTLVSGGAILSRLVSLGAGAGTGLSRGLGSPKLRILALVDARPQALRDSDGDGIHDLADLCRREPEDRDGYRDRDGCPDPDNDEDDIVDALDDCPLTAETYDGYEDHDGCPEAVVHVAVRVVPERGAQTVWVALGDEPPLHGLPGESFRRTLEARELALRAGAPDHETVEAVIALEERHTEHAIELPALRFGTVNFEVRSVDGTALAALVDLGDGEQVPAEGPLRARAGDAAWILSAPGHIDRTVRLSVPADGFVTLGVEMVPTGVRLDGNRVALGDTVSFALDEAVLTDAERAALDDLANWLAARPDIRLLRVEGHADETGSSAHNYQLSVRRAEAVRAHLVDAGVDPGRLQAIGTGEAVAIDVPAERRVDFTVLVWEP